jgi:hypothetical protein
MPPTDPTAGRDAPGGDDQEFRAAQIEAIVSLALEAATQGGEKEADEPLDEETQALIRAVAELTPADLEGGGAAITPPATV